MAISTKSQIIALDAIQRYFNDLFFILNKQTQRLIQVEY